MRKKQIAILMAVLMLLIPLTAFADSTVGVFVGRVEGTPEEISVVEVVLSNCRKLDSIQFTVTFDPEAVSMISAEAGEDIDGIGLHAINRDLKGQVKFAFACADGLQEDKATVLTLELKPLTDRGSAVTISDVIATSYDPSLEVVQYKTFVTVEDGGIYIGENGTVPEAACTPWIPETPTPVPEPTQEPTPVPTEELPEQEQENPVSPVRILAYVCAGLAAVSGVIAAVFLLGRRKS